MQSRTKIIIAILIFLGAVSIAAVVHSVKKPAVVEQIHTVRVLESLRSPYYLPQYLAQNLGFFKEQNLNVTISATSPEAIRNALADGRADIVICGLQKIMFNPASKFPQPKIFAVAAARDGSLLLARQDTEGFQWQNLKHKTIIGGSHDDSSEIALEDVLKNHGLPPYREVTIYYNIPDNLRTAAFRAGTGNYIQMLEPEASLAEFNGYGRVVASVGSAAGDMAVTAYAAMPSNIESNPEMFQKFTNAIYKAQLWMSKHSAEEAAEAAAVSFPNLDQTVLLKSIQRYQSLGVWAANPVIPEESYERFHRAAKNSGEIAGSVPYESIVINDFALNAVQTVVYMPEDEKKENIFQRIFGR
ncbi:ABC transporter substrate-binding protein [Pelotomaculum propionicicum]|uniref:ABC transporter substrate-binding protein n=1 Tax=Pelotomaculum propionicicum TaxID=258475 RepID=UPI003B7B8FFD